MKGLINDCTGSILHKEILNILVSFQVKTRLLATNSKIIESEVP